MSDTPVENTVDEEEFAAFEDPNPQHGQNTEEEMDVVEEDTDADN